MFMSFGININLLHLINTTLMIKRKGEILLVWRAIYMVFAEYQTQLVQEIEKATEMNLMQASNLNIHQPIGYY